MVHEGKELLIKLLKIENSDKIAAVAFLRSTAFIWAIFFPNCLSLKSLFQILLSMTFALSKALSTSQCHLIGSDFQTGP